MEKSRISVILNYFSFLADNYIKFTRESRNFRCKLVGCKLETKTQKIKLHVLIHGIKNQIIEFYPEELVSNDEMLQEFSQYDVRAITFYAFQKQNSEPQPAFVAIYKIYGQEFINNKTIFIIRKNSHEYEQRKYAHELYSDKALLKKFNFDDLVMIITTAIQEQTLEDIEGIYNQ